MLAFFCTFNVRVTLLYREILHLFLKHTLYKTFFPTPNSLKSYPYQDQTFPLITQGCQGLPLDLSS